MRPDKLLVLVSLLALAPTDPARAELGCPAGEGAPLPGLLNVIEAAPEGSWFKANLNSYSDAWSPVELRPKPNGLKAEPSSIIKAWSSFAWDCRRGDLLLFGGGHANYAGNDTYRWRASTRLWERMSLPTEVMQDDLGNWLTVDGPFGSPIAAHTYDNNIYLPFIDRFLAVGGSAWNNGGAWNFQIGPTTDRKTGPYVFDPNKADGSKVGGYTGSHVKRIAPYPEIVGGEMWYNRDIYAFMPLTAIPESFISGATAYMRKEGDRDVVLLSAQSGGSSQTLYKWEFLEADDSASDRITILGRFGTGVSGRGAGTYDPHQNIFVRTALGTKWSNFASSFYYWDLRTPGPDNRNVVFTPTDLSGGWVLDRGYGMDYDPIRRQYLLWGGDSQVWILRPPVNVSPNGWTIERAPIVPTATTPVYVDDTGGGVLGKWKYIPELDAFMGLQNAQEGQIWIYKPVGWIRPGSPLPPVITLSAQPISVAPGGAASLVWVVDNADSCVANGGWSGTRALSGNQTTGALNATTDFGLTCTGEGGSASRSVTVRVELSPPTIATIAGDSCVNAQESGAGLLISGSALSSASVRVQVGAIVKTVTANGAGAWSASLTAGEVGSLPEGSVTVRALQTNESGIQSSERVVTFVKDTQPPAGVPSAPDLVATSDLGASSQDDVTSDKTPTLQGSAPAASRVQLFDGSLPLATMTATSTGSWKVTTSVLASRAYDFSAALQDTCGNTGAKSNVTRVTIDGVVPALTLAAVAGDNRINASEASNGVSVSGTADGDATVTLTLLTGTTQLLSRTAASPGAFNLLLSSSDLASLADANLTFRVLAQDLAGNKRTVSRAVLLDRSVAAPAIAPITGDDQVTATERSAGFAVTGTSEPYASVTLRIGSWSRSAKASNTGAWTVTVPSTVTSALQIGVTQAYATATDVAGNVSLESNRAFTGL